MPRALPFLLAVFAPLPAAAEDVAAPPAPAGATSAPAAAPASMPAAAPAAAPVAAPAMAPVAVPVAAPSAGRGAGFVAAEVPEEVPGGPLMIAAYALVWLVLFGYLVSVWRRQLAVREEIRDLAREVKDLGAGRDGSGA